MDVKSAIIWACVGGAVLLIVAEIVSYLRLAWNTTAAVKDGAESLNRLATAQQLLTESLSANAGGFQPSQLSELAERVDEGQKRILEAGAFLDKLAAILQTLGAKVPLLVGAIVLLLLAAFLSGVINVSATVGTDGQALSVLTGIGYAVS